MPDKLIPGEKKTAVYKKQKFGTPFTMKYQGSHSAFPFHEEGHIELPTSETMSTSVAPVITPITGEPVDLHHSPKGYGLEQTRRRTLKKRKTKNIGEELRKKYGHGKQNN